MDDFQTAPVGCIWGQKLLITALGNSDFVLRLIPLGAGLGSLFLMYSLTRPVNTAARQWAGLTALLLLAVTGPLIYYSSEAKQYSTDVLVTLALLVVARRCLRENASPRDVWWLGIVGVATIWISQPSVFVIADITSALVLSRAIRRIPGRWTPIVGAAVAPAASLCVLYLIVLRAQLANIRPLQEYWSEGFAPLPPWINWM